MATTLKPKHIIGTVVNLLHPIFHKKTCESIAYAVVGVMHADKLGIHAVGHSMAKVLGLDPKHAIKQFDRLLSNDKFDLADAFQPLVVFLVGKREEIVVAMDWTEYAGDGHSRIAVHMITKHGRATPLIWKTVPTSELKARRNDYEDELLVQLAEALPDDVGVTVLADRGFGDTKLYEMLHNDFGWNYIIRFRDIIGVYDDDGERMRARALVPEDGKPIAYKDIALTKAQVVVPLVVAVHAPDMKEPWLLASTRTDLSAEGNVQLYGRRFTIEESFRDEKDRRFGFGLVDATIGSPVRRDRMLYVVSLAMVLLTLLGAAGEELGLDKKLRANTVKNKRTHSLLRQGREYITGALRRYRAALTTTFRRLLRELHVATVVFGVI